MKMKNFELAIDDLAKGLISNIWITIGWNDIRQKYRRSKIGPLWITVSIAVMIAPMAFLYAKILGQNSEFYFPYITISFIFWFYLVALVTESTQAFISSENIIKQIKIPYSCYVLRVIYRNSIIFLHNFLIIIFILGLYGVPTVLNIFLFSISIVLIIFSVFPVCLILAVISVRYRDVPLIITSGTQIIFFITPILWRAEVLGNKIWIANFNPIYHYFEIFRSPLLNDDPAIVSYIFCTIFAIFVWSIALVIFAKSRPRISFWI